MPPPDAQRPITILGAGLVGICTALSLAERGVPVRVIDKGAPGQETSFGNAGVISPWSFIPQSLPGTWKQVPKLMFGPGRPLSIAPAMLPRMIPWGLRFIRHGTPERVRAAADAMEFLCGPSVDLYRRHLSGTGHEALLADGMYVHAFRDGSRASLDAIDYRIRQEKGADLELVGRDRLAEVEPALGPDFQAAVLIKGQARALSPGRIGQVLADKARGLGVTFVTDEVRALRPSGGGWQITCTNDVFDAERVVLSMGAWSKGILDPLGLKLPLMAERGYHIECPDPGVALNNSVMDVDAKVVASSMEGGLRIAGQAEFAPVDAPPNPKRRVQLEKIARAAFPGLKTEGARFWMGRRPSFPDSLPVIGAAPDLDGLFLNFGHSHYGLMMAPKSGEVLADLATGGQPNVDPEAFSASRFTT